MCVLIILKMIKGIIVDVMKDIMNILQIYLMEKSYAWCKKMNSVQMDIIIQMEIASNAENCVNFVQVIQDALIVLLMHKLMQNMDASALKNMKKNLISFVSM